MDGDAGLDRCLHQAGVKFGRVKTGEVRAHHAAVVEVAADFPVLFGLRDHLGVNMEMFVEAVRLAALGFVVRRAYGAGEASDRLVIAVDIFVGDEGRQTLAGGLAFAVESQRRFQPHGFDHLAEADVDVAAGQAAVARRCAFARPLLVENLHRASGAGEDERRRQAGIAGADDGDVAGLGDRCLWQIAWRRRLPPIRMRNQPFGHTTAIPPTEIVSPICYIFSAGDCATPRL